MFFLPAVSLYGSSPHGFSPHESSREEQGERKLLLALLKRAVLDYFGANREESKGAAEWIFDDEHREYSFPWVCEQLELDGDRISTRLEHYRRTGKGDRITRFLSKAR